MVVDIRGLRLTTQECRVLELLRRGDANKEIAHELQCSVRTVEFHVSNLMRKSGESSRLKLVTGAVARSVFESATSGGES